MAVLVVVAVVVAYALWQPVGGHGKKKSELRANPPAAYQNNVLNFPGKREYMGSISMCRREGYGFHAVYSGIGYRNQRVGSREK